MGFALSPRSKFRVRDRVAARKRLAFWVVTYVAVSLVSGPVVAPIRLKISATSSSEAPVLCLHLSGVRKGASI